MKRRGTIRKRTVGLKIDSEISTSVLSADGGPIGDVTSHHSGQALALVRLDRLAKALEAEAPITVDSLQVTIVKSDWLEQELASFSAHE